MVEVTPELEPLAPHEIAEGFTVDVKSGQLKRRGETQPTGRSRRRRGES